MGFIEIMSIYTHTHTHTHTHNIWDGLCRFLSLSFEENKHIGETLSIPFISLPQICCEKRRKKTKQKQISAQTPKRPARLQCTKLISLCYSPKVFPFFSLARCSAPTVRRRHERRKRSSSKDGFVFAICVNLARSNVFTERSIPKLQGPTLSKMNNLIMITLNFLFCYNCHCNILPECFPPLSLPNRHDWNQSGAACLFHSDDKMNLMNLTFHCCQIWIWGLQRVFFSLFRVCVEQRWCLLICPDVYTTFYLNGFADFCVKHFKWTWSSHSFVFSSPPYLAGTTAATSRTV